jgi:hypothetical protein
MSFLEHDARTLLEGQGPTKTLTCHLRNVWGKWSDGCCLGSLPFRILPQALLCIVAVHFSQRAQVMHSRIGLEGLGMFCQQMGYYESSWSSFFIQLLHKGGIPIPTFYLVPYLSMPYVHFKCIGECVSRCIIEHTSHDKDWRLGTTTLHASSRNNASRGKKLLE